MSRTVVTRNISAPLAVVFNTVSNIEHFSKAIPEISGYEILSDVKSGVGTRFRETRVMSGREAVTELEVTEFVDNSRVRLVADTHGTVWDTLFTVQASNGHTELRLTMNAKAHSLLSRVTTPLIQGMVKKAIEKNMDAVKEYCEKQAAGAS